MRFGLKALGSEHAELHRAKNVKNPKLSSIIYICVRCGLTSFVTRHGGSSKALADRNSPTQSMVPSFLPTDVPFIQFVIIQRVCSSRLNSISLIILNKNVEKLPREFSSFSLRIAFRFPPNQVFSLACDAISIGFPSVRFKRHLVSFYSANGRSDPKQTKSECEVREENN